MLPFGANCAELRGAYKHNMFESHLTHLSCLATSSISEREMSETTPEECDATPLRRSDQEHEPQDADEEKPTPLPIAQLLCVYLIQFAEPITATVIYPFINQFVRETGITNGDEGKTGYYAGIIVRILPWSGFALVHLILAGICFLYGRMLECRSVGLPLRPVWSQANLTMRPSGIIICHALVWFFYDVLVSRRVSLFARNFQWQHW